MTTVGEVLSFLFELAPAGLALPQDNVGLMAGRSSASVNRALVALEVTDTVIDEAIDTGCELIVTHHPLIFSPLRSVTDADAPGAYLLRLAERGIAVISMHTNLDAAGGGVNDSLAARLGLTGVGTVEGTDGIVRMGELARAMSGEDFARMVRDRLSCHGVRWQPSGKPVLRAAVGGGACGEDLHAVHAAGCDAFVTADVKHHVMLEAARLGILLVDAGHFHTEDVICAPLARAIAGRFTDITAKKSVKYTDTVQFL